MINTFFDMFQIVGIAFFMAILIGRTIYLKTKKNINPISLGVGKNGLKQVLEIAFIVGLVIWITEVLFAALHTTFRLFPKFLYSELVNESFVKVFGVLLILVSLYLFVWALVSFQDSWRVGIDTKTNGKLITTGIFSYSRNPIFLFIDLYFFGTFLINGTLLFLLMVLVVIAGLHYQILQEESFLSTAHTDEYASFCQKTDRYWGQYQG